MVLLAAVAAEVALEVVAGRWWWCWHGRGYGHGYRWCRAAASSTPAPSPTQSMLKGCWNIVPDSNYDC